MNKLYRKEEILKLCTGKNVLHLGFIQHSNLYEQLIEKGIWLHEKINQVAKSLVGIDYLKDDVNIIAEKYNYECYYGDVTDLSGFNYSRIFDVIICGELIEHLENPGLMLDEVKRFMNDKTLLIITTPNPWSRQRLKLLKKGISEKEWLNEEHTCWYSFFTLKQLLERKGYQEFKYTYYSDESVDEINMNYNTFLQNYMKIKGKLLRRNLPDYYLKGLFFIAKIDKQ